MVSPDWLKGSRHRGKRGPSRHKLRRSYSNAIGTHAIFPSVRSHLHSKFPRWRRPPVPTHRARPMNPPPSSPACQARISCAAPRTSVRDDPTPRSARLRTAQRDASHTLPLGARTPPSAHRRSDDADLSDSAGRAKRASRRNKYSGIKPRIGEPSSPATERATDHAQRNPHLAFFLPSGFSGRVRPCPRTVRLQVYPTCRPCPPSGFSGLVRPCPHPVRLHGCSRYPVFRTVRRWRGDPGSRSSFRRSSAMCVSTVRLTISASYPHTSCSSSSRDAT